jgi:hypothetical protein
VSERWAVFGPAFGCAGASAVEKVRQILSALGIEQQKTESLAETFARALGITSRELRSRLADAARESSWA